jgi:hypothetical protein
LMQNLLRIQALQSCTHKYLPNSSCFHT